MTVTEEMTRSDVRLELTIARSRPTRFVDDMALGSDRAGRR
jgi:hypothetical protein